ncbi:unnamed protein product [Musa textilis]
MSLRDLRNALVLDVSEIGVTVDPTVAPDVRAPFPRCLRWEIHFISISCTRAGSLPISWENLSLLC